MVISAATHNSQHHITLRQWCYSNIHTGSCIYNASGRTGVILDVSWCKHPQSKRAPESWNNTMLRSWHGNASRITGHLWGKSTGHRWIPLTKEQWYGALMLHKQYTPRRLHTLSEDTGSFIRLYQCQWTLVDISQKWSRRHNHSKVRHTTHVFLH